MEPGSRQCNLWGEQDIFGNDHECLSQLVKMYPKSVTGTKHIAEIRRVIGVNR